MRELVECRRNKHICSCMCLVCGKRSQSVSQAWRCIATHVNKGKSNEMVYVVSKIEQQCHMCHKMFPSQRKNNLHLEHVHKVSDNSCPYTRCTVCEVLNEVPMFNLEEQFQTDDLV
jgi:hypothetical protein